MTVGDRKTIRVAPVAIAGVVVAAVAVRFYDLDRLPGEIYGDVAELIGTLREVLEGRWPTHFVLSAGPLYNYAIAPIVAVLGTSYWTLKVASCLTGLAAVAAIGWFAAKSSTLREAWVTAFIAGVSYWLLVFSRLGHSLIVIPLVSAVTLALAFSAFGRPASGRWLAAAAAASTGFYCYPQTFVLPPLVLGLQATSVFSNRGARGRGLVLLAGSILLVAVCAIPAYRIITRDWGGDFRSGYVFGHAFESGRLPPDAGAIFLRNVRRGLGMLHVEGDGVFRSNPPGRPQLDPVSGICFFAGLAAFLAPGRRATLARLAAAYLLLLLPSLLVLTRPAEVPSASRSLALTPIAYLFVGSGVVSLARWAGARIRPKAEPVSVALLLAAITLLNLRIYFVDYPRHLPNGNVPFGRVIAETIDALPADVDAYLLGCCWGEWGQPEPKGIAYAFVRPRRLIEHPDGVFACADLRQKRSVYVVMPPTDAARIAAVEGCLRAEATIKRVAGVDVFAAVDSHPQP